MKKKIIIVTMLAAVMAVPVFAATFDQTEVPDSVSQMSQRHEKMVQQAVDNGTITREEAVQMNENMQKMAPIMGKMMKSGGMMQKSDMMGNCNNTK